MWIELIDENSEIITRMNKSTIMNKSTRMNKTGHDHLLELRLLEKSARHDFIIARHDFIIARHRSSNNIFSCQLLESS